MLTMPNIISKGTEVDFELNVPDFLEHPGITDSYYQNPRNVEKVVFFYQSSVGNQTKRVNFPIVEGEDVSSGKFSSSAKARNLFQVKTIFLFDYDGAFFPLERSALSVSDKSEFDVALVAP